MPEIFEPSGTPGQLVTANGFTIKQDASGNLGIYNTGGVEMVFISDSGSGNPRISAVTGKVLRLAAANGLDGITIQTNQTLSLNKTVGSFNGVNAAGLGVIPIYKQGVQTLFTNAAPTTLSYTPPATAGSYMFLPSPLNILTGATLTFSVKITYKDAGGNARTDVPLFMKQGSATLLVGGPAANDTGQFSMLPYAFDIDNSATPITIQDNAGTYTAGTYYWTPSLVQVG